MKVIEIFDSIDGEGIRTGQCATFIRLAGCNLRCSYCDTVYSLFGEETPCEYTEMTVDEIISKVNMTYKRVTPVSYTHLDVYKRQLKFIYNGIGHFDFCIAFCFIYVKKLYGCFCGYIGI